MGRATREKTGLWRAGGLDAGRRPRFLDALDPLRVDHELLRERQRPLPAEPERRQRGAPSLKDGGDRVEALKLLLWGSALDG